MDVPTQLALKIAASIAIGLLLGLEREWAHKEVGVRSFTVTTLLGTLSWQLASTLAFAQFGIIALMILLVNTYTLWKERHLQVTTSLALAAANILGIAIGAGDYFLAFAGTIAIAALLSWKTELVTFSGKLTEKEIRGVLLLAFITVVVYPLLPASASDPWHIINPRSIWLTVILVSLIKFLNYVLLRIFGERGLRYSSLLGGIVNSAAMAFFLGVESKREAQAAREAPINMSLAGTAMILRNWSLVLLFTFPFALARSLPTVLVLAPTMFIAGGVAALAAWSMHRQEKKQSKQPPYMQENFAGPVEPRERTVGSAPEAIEQPIAARESAYDRTQKTPEQQKDQADNEAQPGNLPEQHVLTSPLSLRSVLLFALIFFALTVLSGAGRALFGNTGFLIVIVLGALASAASSAVLLGQELAKGVIGAMPSALAMYLATVAGLLENIVIFWIVTHRQTLARRLFLLSLPAIGCGALMILLVTLFHW